MNVRTFTRASLSKIAHFQDSPLKIMSPDSAWASFLGGEGEPGLRQTRYPGGRVGTRWNIVPAAAIGATGKGTGKGKDFEREFHVPGTLCTGRRPASGSG